jgi:hypothetical protein
LNKNNDYIENTSSKNAKKIMNFNNSLIVGRNSDERILKIGRVPSSIIK